jgi:hypothetical protein
MAKQIRRHQEEVAEQEATERSKDQQQMQTVAGEDSEGDDEGNDNADSEQKQKQKSASSKPKKRRSSGGDKEDSYLLAMAQAPTSHVRPLSVQLAVDMAASDDGSVAADESESSSTSSAPTPRRSGAGVTFGKALLVAIGAGVIGASGFIIWRNKRRQEGYEAV